MKASAYSEKKYRVRKPFKIKHSPIEAAIRFESPRRKFESLGRREKSDMQGMKYESER